MSWRALASKKNVIILIVVVTLVLLASSYRAKRAVVQHKVALGGQVELVVPGRLFGAEIAFLRAQSAKISIVMDMTTKLPLPKDEFEAHVRAIDNNYPMQGELKLDPGLFKTVFIADTRNNLFGVAVNQLFLKRTGMQLGETFTMGNKNYQLRGLILSLPDESGKAMNKYPLLLLKDYAMAGSGMFMYSSQHELRYRLFSRGLSPEAWEAAFKKQFPKSTVVINR